jgi:N-methylhydantoinase A
MIREAFETAYQASFSRLLPGVPMRIVNLRTSAIGIRPSFDLKALSAPTDTTVASATTGTRQVWFDGAWHDTVIYARLDLPEGSEIQGPAILEQPDATTVVSPEFKARVDLYGNIIVERKA